MIGEDEFCQVVIDHVTASGTAGLGNNYNRIVPSIIDGRWTNELRVAAANAHQGKLHSWMASVITSGQKRRGARMDHVWGLRLRGYLYVWDNGDADNSEKYLRAELKALKRRFAEHNDLALDQQATGYLRHEEIQETNRAIQFAGGAGCHVVNLFLLCHLYENLTTP